MNNNILHNKNSAIFIAAVLVAGVFATISSPLAVYGQQYEQDYDSYYQSDPRMDDHSYDKKHSDKKGQSANCDNKNVNINDIRQIQRQSQAVGNTIGEAATLNGESISGEEALNALTGNGDPSGSPLLNIDRNIVNICINSNENELEGTFVPTQGQDATGTPEDTTG